MPIAWSLVTGSESVDDGARQGFQHGQFALKPLERVLPQVVRRVKLRVVAHDHAELLPGTAAAQERAHQGHALQVDVCEFGDHEDDITVGKQGGKDLGPGLGQGASTERHIRQEAQEVRRALPPEPASLTLRLVAPIAQ